MAKYEFRMNLIRSGQTIPLDDGAYDPAADIKAHSSHLKVRVFPDLSPVLTIPLVAGEREGNLP